MCWTSNSGYVNDLSIFNSLGVLHNSRKRNKIRVIHNILQYKYLIMSSTSLLSKLLNNFLVTFRN